ncbi:MAG: hypothetical protein MHM6MM_009641 [Cercozoa sp. M6MM]
MVGAANSACWTVYGLADSNAFIWAPNAASFLVVFAQLFLKLRYRKCESATLETPTGSEVGLTEVDENAEVGVNACEVPVVKTPVLINVDDVAPVR